MHASNQLLKHIIYGHSSSSIYDGAHVCLAKEANISVTFVQTSMYNLQISSKLGVRP